VQKVTLFEAPDFAGRSLTLDVGQHRFFTPDDFNDLASSIRVPAGFVAMLFEHADNGGGYGKAVDLLEDCGRPVAVRLRREDLLCPRVHHAGPARARMETRQHRRRAVHRRSLRSALERGESHRQPRRRGVAARSAPRPPCSTRRSSPTGSAGCAPRCSSVDRRPAGLGQATTAAACYDPLSSALRLRLLRDDPLPGPTLRRPQVAYRHPGGHHS
jgi:hypothetical protein